MEIQDYNTAIDRMNEVEILRPMLFTFLIIILIYMFVDLYFKFKGGSQFDSVLDGKVESLHLELNFIQDGIKFTGSNLLFVKRLDFSREEKTILVMLKSRSAKKYYMVEFCIDSSNKNRPNGLQIMTLDDVKHVLSDDEIIYKNQFGEPEKA